MKRKLVMITVLAILSMVLAACGSNSLDLGEQKEEIAVANADIQTQEIAVKEQETVLQSNVESMKEWITSLNYDDYKYCIWNKNIEEGYVLENGEIYQMEEGDILLLYAPQSPGRMTFSPSDIIKVEMRGYDGYNVLEVSFEGEIHFHSTVFTQSDIEFDFEFTLIAPLEENAPILAEAEIIEQEAEPTWYMDAEGIKNDELGVVIRKEKYNDTLDRIYLWEYVNIPSSGYGGETVRCEYYEDDLDTYISEHSSDWEKGKIEDVDYAYDSSNYEVVFAGNGIIVFLSIHELRFEDISLSDYLDKIDLIKSYDESNMDCLAYVTANGLYCPVLGIKFSCNGGENTISNINICCESPRHDSASITIQDQSIYQSSYMADTKNAQEVVDKFVEEEIERKKGYGNECSAIEEIAEINIGKCKYLGRCVVEDYQYFKALDWLFYSDDTTWSIEVYFTDAGTGSKYEDHISVIENLE